MDIVLANLIVVVHTACPCRCVVIDCPDLVREDYPASDVCIGTVSVPDNLRRSICQVYRTKGLAVTSLH